MVRWLFSIDTKAIGTLFVIFSISAGMISTAFPIITELLTQSDVLGLHFPLFLYVFVTARILGGGCLNSPAPGRVASDDRSVGSTPPLWGKRLPNPI
jgi:hypothetical protein